MYKDKKRKLQVQKPLISFLSKETDYNQGEIEEISGCYKIGSLFLVMSYDKKYSKLEKAIKIFFDGIYTVHITREYIGQNVLSCICEKIRDSDFGIVVLAGLKEYKSKKGRIKCSVKMNIPFEYGMLQILEKPVMLICEDKSNLDIDKEFSDIKSENFGEKRKISNQQKKIEKCIGEIFKKFIPELAKWSAKKAIAESGAEDKIAVSKIKKLQLSLKNLYEIQIKNDFKERLN